MSYTLHLGDCLKVMPTLAANSIDSIVCDPPYGLSFMGKNWDHGVPGAPFWEAALRVAKPGAMLLAFGGTRTFHRLTCAIEDAGWEIRDCLMWLYGSGFPKSMDISKAIDKAAGAKREDAVKGGHKGMNSRGDRWSEGHNNLKRAVKPSINMGAITRGTPVTDAARQWQGWGTALKPAWEPIIMAMRPIDGTFANNALVHDVAGLNIDGCRIEGAPPKVTGKGIASRSWREKENRGDISNETREWNQPSGRWPANLLLDKEAAAMLDEQSSDASRFFYIAKASRHDRNEGLEGIDAREKKTLNDYVHPSEGRTAPKNGSPAANHHPTVKPTQLMRYLCRLVTRHDGVILDPFMGSGSTGKAAMLEGFGFVGIELDADYVAIAQRRIEQAAMQPLLLEPSA